MARAANSFLNMGLGQPVLIGRLPIIKEAFASAGIEFTGAIETHDTSGDDRRHEYAEFLYSRLQRKGYLLRDCQRLVNNDRNVYGACMVAMGHADGMVTGVTRNWYTAYEDVRKVLDARPGRRVIGVSLAICRGRAVLIADTSVHDMPTAEQLADIATEAARVARNFGIEPRVAMLAYSTFGQPRGERSDPHRPWDRRQRTLWDEHEAQRQRRHERGRDETHPVEHLALDGQVAPEQEPEPAPGLVRQEARDQQRRKGVEGLGEVRAHVAPLRRPRPTR